MLAVGTKVLCSLLVMVQTDIGYVQTFDKNAKGTILTIGEKLLVVDFTNYAIEQNYPGNFRQVLIDKDSYVKVP